MIILNMDVLVSLFTSQEISCIERPGGGGLYYLDMIFFGY